MATSFAAFQRAFPPAASDRQSLTAPAAADVVARFGVAFPPELIEFWNVVGPGYYGDNELYFFGANDAAHDAASQTNRRNLIAWNELPLWRKILPPPCEGGPLFFAETCFGEQLGFRYDAGRCLAVLLILDTMESFLLAQDLTELFEVTLTHRFAVTDPDRYQAVRARLGRLPPNKHYAPIDFPLLGGTGDAENFRIEDPTVHLATTVAVYEAIKLLPPGTPISGINLEWE